MNFANAADLRYQREQNPIFEQWNVSELTKDENFIFFGGHSGKLMVINFNKVRQILAESKIMAQSRDGQNRNLPQTKAICEPDKVITRLPPPDKKSQNNVVSIEAFIKSEVIVGTECGSFYRIAVRKGQQISESSLQFSIMINQKDKIENPIMSMAVDPKFVILGNGKALHSIFLADSKDRIIFFPNIYEPAPTVVYNKKELKHKTEASKHQKSYVVSMNISNSGQFLAAGDKHGDITLFNLTRESNGQIIRVDVHKVFNAHDFYVSSVRFSTDGKFMISVSGNNSIFCAQLVTEMVPLDETNIEKETPVTITSFKGFQ